MVQEAHPGDAAPSDVGGRSVLLALLDFGLPVALGAGLVALLWTTFISHCRGWESWDPASHLQLALDLFHGESLTAVRGNAYGPLVYIWTSLIFFLFGPGRQTAELSIALFLLPLSLGAYHLGRAWGGRPAGLICMLFLSLHGAVLRDAQAYLLDLPQLTMVTLMLLFLLRTRLFQSPGYSALLGLTMAVGMLIKSNFFYFCLPPLLLGLVVLFRAARNPLLPVALILAGGGLTWAFAADAVPMDRDLYNSFWYLHLLAVGLGALAVGWGSRLIGRGRVGAELSRSPEALASLGNALAAAILAVGAVLPWYIMHRAIHMEVFWDIRGRSVQMAGTAGIVLSFLAEAWVGAPLMLAVGIFFLARRPDGWQTGLAVGAGAIFAGVALAVTTDCQERFMTPLLPSLLLISTWWVRLLGPRGKWAAMGILALQLPFLAGGFNAEPRTQIVRSRLTILSDGYAPSPEEERRCALHKSLADLVVQIRRGGPPPPSGCLFRDHRHDDEVFDQGMIPGFTCGILASYMEHSSYRYPRCSLKHMKAAGAAGQGEGIFFYPEHRDAPIQGLGARLLKGSGASMSYWKFYPLAPPMGLHLFKVKGDPGKLCP